MHPGPSTARSLSIIPALLLASAPWARAQAAPASAQDALRTASETRARSDLTSLFQTLCPDQCVLLSVTASVDDQAAPGVDPGFEGIAGDDHIPVLQSIDTAVLVDAALPPAFRVHVKDLINLRLKALGAAASSITVDSLAFPPRTPPPQAQAPLAPSPAPPVSAPRDWPAPAPPAPITVRDRLLDAAPALVAVAMLAVALLVLGALLFAAIRRPRETSDWPEGGAGEPIETEAEAVAQPFPIARAQRLEKTLTDERGLRNEIVRTALSRGEVKLVALWVRELGELVVNDLHAERSLSATLHELAMELARAPSHDASERARALYELESRVFSTRLARTAEPGQQQFSFFEGVRPEHFLTAWQSVSPGGRETALRFAPPSLREAALRRLSAAEQAELALVWARRPAVTPAYASAAAEEWRTALSGCAGTSEQVERVLSDLLELLPRADQDALVARLRREGEAGFGANLATESILLQASPEALSTAALSLPSERLVAYLARADAELRDAVLACCPTRLQQELREELTNGAFASRDEFLAARRALLDALREPMLSDGRPTSAGRPRLAVVG